MDRVLLIPRPTSAWYSDCFGFVRTAWAVLAVHLTTEEDLDGDLGVKCERRDIMRTRFLIPSFVSGLLKNHVL